MSDKLSEPLLQLAKNLIESRCWPSANGYQQPSGQGRDEISSIMWIYSDEGDWNNGGSGYQVPDLMDIGTGAALLSLLMNATCLDIYCREADPDHPWQLRMVVHKPDGTIVSLHGRLGVICAKALLDLWGDEPLDTP